MILLFFVIFQYTIFGCKFTKNLRDITIKSDNYLHTLQINYTFVL